MVAQGCCSADTPKRLPLPDAAIDGDVHVIEHAVRHDHVDGLGGHPWPSLFDHGLHLVAAGVEGHGESSFTVGSNRRHHITPPQDPDLHIGEWTVRTWALERLDWTGGAKEHGATDPTLAGGGRAAAGAGHEEQEQDGDRPHPSHGRWTADHPAMFRLTPGRR